MAHPLYTTGELVMVTVLGKLLRELRAANVVSTPDADKMLSEAKDTCLRTGSHEEHEKIDSLFTDIDRVRSGDIG